MVARPVGRARRWLLVAGALVLLPVAVALAWLAALDLDGLVRRRLDELKPDLEARLGRRIELGAVEVRLLPRLAVSIEEIVVAGGAPGKAPLLRIGALRLGVPLGPLLRRRGRDLAIDRLEVLRPELTLLRRADGSLDLPRLEPRPLTDGQRQRLAALRLAAVELRDGRVAYREAAHPEVELAIQGLRLELREVSLERPLDLRCTGDLLGGRGNVELRAELAPPLDQGAPRPPRLLVTLRELDLPRLRQRLPQVDLPDGLELRGRASLEVELHGPAIRGELEATAAGIRIAALHKRPGAPARLELLARRDEGGLAIERLGVRLGAVAATLHGRFDEAGHGTLALDEATVELAGLGELVPGLGNEPLGSELRGRLRLDGDLTRTAAETALQLAARGSGITIGWPLRAGALRFDGAPELRLAVTAAPVLQARAQLDLERTRVRLGEAFDKPVNTPLTVAASGSPSASGLLLRELRLQLPGATLDGRAQLRRGGQHLDGQLALRELDLHRLAAFVPRLRSLPPWLRELRGGLRLAYDGPLPRLAGALRVDAIDLTLLGGQLRGRVTLRDLANPAHFELDLEGERLDLDQLGASGGGAMPAGLAAHGRIRLRSAQLGGLLLDGLDGEVKADGGHLELRRLRAATCDGTIDLGGTTLDLGGPSPVFALRARLARIDLDALLRRAGSALAGKITGRATLDLAVEGRGRDFAAVAPTLRGQLGLTLEEARLKGLSLGGKITNPLLGKLKAVGKRPPRQELYLHQAKARFGLGDSRLTTVEPLRLAVDEGELVLRGWIGLDRQLALDGALLLSPLGVEAASDGKLVLDRVVEVPLRVRRDLAAQPEIELLDPGTTVKDLIGAQIRGKLKRLGGGR